MKARVVAFGLVELDGQTYDYDVLVERGRVSRRLKKASKPQRDRYGHPPSRPRSRCPGTAAS
jgi:hypothetical protein